MNLPNVAILAGGLAQRLKPITETVPKAMLEISGKPFISYQLKQLRNQGIERVVLCVGHQCEQIEKFVGDGSDFGIKVQYSYDGDKLLGTGGALINAIEFLDEIFFVTYGDTLLDVSYVDVFNTLKNASSQYSGIVTVLENKNQWDKSNTQFKNGKILAHNKKSQVGEMNYIDYGLSMFRKKDYAEWIGSIENGTSIDLSDAISFFAQKGKLLGYEVKSRFYEIGTPESLFETTKMIEERKNPKWINL
jgi:NDP-sugar pyrophosphorylase family protein